MVAVSNITDNWNNYQGNFTTDAAFETADGHITGTRTYKKGNDLGNDEIWASSKKFIKYNPKSIYEIEVRIKSSGSGLGTDYIGFTGYAADKTTKISTTGANVFDGSTLRYIKWLLTKLLMMNGKHLEVMLQDTPQAVQVVGT